MTITEPISESTLSRSDQWHAVSASFMGWTLDAFDFFVLVFLVDTLAAQFHVPASKIILTITATLAMRPLGALVFGLLADRYGRRRPLMANVVFFSLFELLCGFAPNYTVFLILRAIYGIGMGGEWGVGASLAMESAPKRWRGILSGIVQSGYPIGYLLAAVAARFVLPMWGWRAMFWVGGIPALLAFYIRFRVKESEAWKQHRAPTVGAILRTASGHWKIFSYLVLLMTLMMFLSHGTQDLYPHFLREVHKASCRHHLVCRHPIQPRCSAGIVLIRILVGELRPQAHHPDRVGSGACRDSRLGVWRIVGDSCPGRISHADGSAGSVGSYSGTLE